MNSLLQIFFSIDELRNAILMIDNNCENRFLFELQKIFIGLSLPSESKKPIQTEQLIQSLGIETSIQNDAHEICRMVK